jgi:hypothetical protein
MNSALFGIAVTQGIYYYWYEYVKAFFAREKALTVGQGMLAGAIAGIPLWLFIHRQDPQLQLLRIRYGLSTLD